jgi:hypothetical protein
LKIHSKSVAQVQHCSHCQLRKQNQNRNAAQKHTLPHSLTHFPSLPSSSSSSSSSSTQEIQLLVVPFAKAPKKKKKKTSKNSKKKITKNPQKFAKILKESVRHFTDIPKVLIPKTKTPFPCDSPPCSSSFRRRRRRRRLHVPFLPCSNVACFRALFSWRKHCAYCAK